MINFGKSFAVDLNNPVPKYHQMAMAIMGTIEKGELNPGDKLPPEKELADQFQISYLTARQAVAFLEKKGILKRIHGRGTFVAQDAGCIKREIYFAFPGLSPYIARILDGIESVLRTHDCILSVCDCGFDLAKEREYIRELLDNPEAGLIWYPAASGGRDNRDFFAKLAGKKYPVVFVDHFFESDKCNYVISDDIAGAEMAVEYLIKQGHRRIACLTSANTNISSVRNRVEGYRRTLEKSGIVPDDDLVKSLSFTSSIMEKNVFEAGDVIRSWRKMKNPPSAIFTTSDEVAAVALRIAYELGLTVPGELAITSYGDTECASLQVCPLTAVSIPMHEMGAEAARLLLDKNADISSGNKKVILHPSLSVRKST